MSERSEIEQSGLHLRPRAGTKDRTYWDAQWRYRVRVGPWKQKTRRIGLAWMEPDALGWRKRRGRCPDGWLDERHATAAALVAMDEFAIELSETAQRAREAAARKPTVRELARASGSTG